MKMPFKVLALVLLASFGATNVAQASCKEKFGSRVDVTPRVVAGATGALIPLVAGNFGIVVWPVGLAGLGVTAAWFILSDHLDRAAYKILDQAEAGHGGKVTRLYKQYLKIAKEPVSFSEFCQILHEADLNESLCRNDVKLHKFDIIQYVSDKE